MSFSFAAGAECTGTPCFCERSEQRPVCVSGCACIGMHRDTLTKMEASAGSNHLGHTSDHGLHFHLQWTHCCTLGPGKMFQQGLMFLYLFFAATLPDLFQMHSTVVVYQSCLYFLISSKIFYLCLSYQ